MHTIKRHHIYFHIFAILAVSIGCTYYFYNTDEAINVKAGSTYQASSVFGQLDRDGNPNFTRNLPNNIKGDEVFNNPSYLALDDINHRLYVADPNNERILVFSLDEDNLINNIFADNVLAQDSFNRSYVSLFAEPSECAGMGAMELDKTNSRLFVSCGPGFIMWYDVSGEITNGMDSADSIQNGGSYQTPDNTTFGVVSDISYDEVDQRLFVLDASLRKVMVYDFSGDVGGVMTAINEIGQVNFATFESHFPPDDHTLSNPTSLDYDSDNKLLYVADSTEIANQQYAPRILVFDLSGGITDGMSASFVIGQADMVSGSQNVSDHELGSVLGTKIRLRDDNDRLYVSDGNRVLIFPVPVVGNGVSAVGVLGQDTFDINDPVTPNTVASVTSASGLVYVDGPTPHLYVADSSGSRLVDYDMSDFTNGMDAVNVIGHRTASGDPNFTTNGTTSFLQGPPWNMQNPLPALDGFNQPTEMVFDNINHRAFVIDSQNYRVLGFDLDENNNLVDQNADYVIGQNNFDDHALPTAINASTFWPGHIAFDENSNTLFISDGQQAGVDSRILAYNLDNFTNGMSATNVLGQIGFDTLDNQTNNGMTDSSLIDVSGLAYDNSLNRLFVVDGSTNNRVLIYNLNDGITDGMEASQTLSGDFTTPYSIYFDNNNNNILIGDITQNKVYIYNSDLSFANYLDNIYPVSIFSDGIDNRIFVSDSTQNRVYVFDSNEIIDGEDPLGVIGQATIDGAPEQGLSNELYSTVGQVYYDSASNVLYVFDTYNNRIMMYNLPILSQHSFDSNLVGSELSYNFEYNNLQGAASFELISGELPNGFSIVDDLFSGVADVIGDYTFGIRLKDTGTYGDILGNNVNYSLNVYDNPPPAPIGYCSKPDGCTPPPPLVQDPCIGCVQNNIDTKTENKITTKKISKVSSGTKIPEKVIAPVFVENKVDAPIKKQVVMPAVKPETPIKENNEIPKALAVGSTFFGFFALGAEILRKKVILHGVIVSTIASKPMAEIEVSVINEKLGKVFKTFTDKMGNYSFTLPKGEYKLVAQKPRSRIYKKEIDIKLHTIHREVEVDMKLGKAKVAR